MRFPTRTRTRTGQAPEHQPAVDTVVDVDADSGSCCAFDLVEDDEQPQDPRSA